MKNGYGGYSYDPSEVGSMQDLITHIYTFACDEDCLKGWILSGDHGHAYERHLSGHIPDPLPPFMAQTKDMLSSTSNPADIQFPDKTIQSQINRIAYNCVPSATHFASYNDMAYALHVVLTQHAEEIAKWVNNTRGNYQRESRSDVLKMLQVDVGRFIGGGITQDGNEYRTSNVKVVLGDFNCHPGYINDMPFSIVTMFPDIENHFIGSVYCTGNNYGRQLEQTINDFSDTNAKIYWILKSRGEDAQYIPATETSDSYVSVTRNLGMKYKSDGAPVQCQITFDYNYDKLRSKEFFLTRNGERIRMTRESDSENALRITSNEEQYKAIHEKIWNIELPLRKIINEAKYQIHMLDNATVDLFPQDTQGVVCGVPSYLGIDEQSEPNATEEPVEDFDEI